MTTTTNTSELYWLSAALLTLVDLSAIACLSQCIPAETFKIARLEIVGMAVLFWGGLWGALMVSDNLWQSCYCYIFTHTQRWLMPLGMALLYGAASYGMWWLASRLSIHPVFTFAGLAAVLSLPDHLYAVYVKDILSTPLFQNVSPAATIIFGIFEFVFYWILILSIAVLLRAARAWRSDHNFKEIFHAR